MKNVKALAAVGLVGFATVLVTPTASGAGADVILSGIDNDIDTFGPVNVGGNDVYAYIIGSNTCNIGDQALAWSNALTGGTGTPALAMNAFRLHNGRLQQIGIGMMKTACCVSNSPNCSMTCSGSGSGLRAGCMDTYWAGWNSSQSRLKPRKNVNAFTGTFTGTTGVTGTAVAGRMQVLKADMDPATYPGALYFHEGHYICTEDATNGNWYNNASYTRVTMNASYVASPAGGVEAGDPAIYAWRDHGLGVGVVDPSVVIQNVDVPGEGRFIVASKVTQTGRNAWHYEYAIHNFNSDRCAGSFRLPLPAGANITNVGFSDVWYHGDDAIFDGTNWNNANNGYELRWSTTQTHAQNVNANAIRWGTMYNFWFDSNTPPVAGAGEIDLFKPAVGCQPTTVKFNVQTPGMPCDADAVRDGTVNVTDLLEVISDWGACACQYDCNANIAGGDASVNVTDLLAVIGAWGSCP